MSFGEEIAKSMEEVIKNAAKRRLKKWSIITNKFKMFSSKDFRKLKIWSQKSIISHYQQNAGCIDLVQSREGALLCVKKYKKI
jgi:hypothetical protein